MTAALDVDALHVTLGGAHVLDGVSLAVGAGEVVALIGPNGAGKTTLIDAVSGFVAYAGDVRVRGRTLRGRAAHERSAAGVARTFQSLELFEDLSVTENLQVAAGDARETLVALGLTSLADRLPSTLSQAQRKAVALARALVARPAVLLLDEPAAGLDPEQRTELRRRIRAIAATGTGVLLVDHDMGLVLQACDRVCVLDRGRLIASAAPEQVRRDPAVLAAYLGGTPAATPATPAATPAPRPSERPSEQLLQAERLSAGYGGVPVLDEVSLEVGAGEVVALLGRNGAGKTTTLSALAGLLRPTSGTVTVLGGPPARPERLARRGLTLLPQDRALLQQLTGWENLRLVRGAPAYDGVLAHFPQLPPVLHRPVGLLSGGQQQQLALARALLTRPRLLLIDELSMGLAPQVVDGLLAAVRGTADEQGLGVLLVEQHVPLALAVADRGYLLDRGRVVLSGTTPELASRPELLAAGYLGGE